MSFSIYNFYSSFLFLIIRLICNWVEEFWFRFSSSWSACITYSLINTRRRGAHKSLIPYTYALAGCLIAHINSIRIIIVCNYCAWKTFNSGWVLITSIFICFKFFFSKSERCCCPAGSIKFLTESGLKSPKYFFAISMYSYLFLYSVSSRKS